MYLLVHTAYLLRTNTASSFKDSDTLMIGCIASDIPRSPPRKRSKQPESPIRRPSKVRSALLPPEYHLCRILGEATNAHPSWSTNTTACEWDGIKCNEDLEINEIIWSRHDVTAQIKLEYLPRTLRNLDLSYNFFRGEINPEILPSPLQEISLHSNLFSGTVDFSTFSYCLTEIFLSSNRFSGDICLSSLPCELVYLSLNDNSFIGAPDLRHFPSKLRYLNLSSNLFAGEVCLDRLPPSLKNLLLKDNPLLRGNVSTSSLPWGFNMDFALGTAIVINYD